MCRVPKSAWLGNYRKFGSGMTCAEYKEEMRNRWTWQGEKARWSPYGSSKDGQC